MRFAPLGKWVYSGYFSQESIRVCNSNNIIHRQDGNVASRDIETPRLSHIACFRETLTRHESGLLSTFGGGDSDHTCTQLHLDHRDMWTVWPRSKYSFYKFSPNLLDRVMF